MVDARVSIMCEHCIDCFFRDEDGDREQCIFDLENPVEINYSDPACEHFELRLGGRGAAKAAGRTVRKIKMTASISGVSVLYYIATQRSFHAYVS